jgi:ankyrin repeat protein
LLSFRVDLPNWNLNPQKIEGILGLWLWSLKHDKRLETGDGHGNKISVADKIQKARIIGMVQLLGFEDWGRLFERWLDRPGRLEGRTLDLYIPEDDITDPRTIWQDTCPCVPAESETIDKTLPENLIRFGGWGNVAHYALKDLVKVRAIFVEEPLDLFCTVELFCTVLRAILEDNSIQLGEPAPIEKEGRLGWENEKVSKVLSAFVDGMLGTHYNAMCLIPILTGHVWVPKGRFLLSALLKSSIQYQQKQEWQRAEAMLKDACLDYQSSPIEGIRGLQEALSHNATITDLHKFTRYLRFEECLSAVVALGELYLSALWCAPSNRILEKFGTSGIRWMQQNLTKEAERANRWKLPQRRDTLDDPPIYTMHADRDPSYGALIESIILTYTLNACELLGSHQDVRRPGKEGWMAWRPKSAYQDSSLDTANISYPLSYREERNRLSQARFLISSSSQIALSPSVPYDELILSAVEHSSPEVLAWILERTKDFHIKDDEIQAAIQRCLEKDDAVIFKVFLDYGVNFEHFEQTFGHYHSTDVFWLLLDLGVDMNWGTILLSCIESNWLEAVASLLRKRKTYPDRENSDKRTALLIASEQGNLAMVNRLLREKHFHPNVEDNEGFTALERAAEKGHVSVVDRLLDVPGIELRWKADNKCKPLVIMAVGHIVEYPKILTKLLQPDMIWKIDKTYVHSDGRSLLSYAAEKGLETAVKDLLNQKEKNKAFNPDLQDDYGRTPLSYAAAAGNEKIVDMLLEVSEVNPNSTDVEGRTPAVWAESNGHNGIALKIAERIN